MKKFYIIFLLLAANHLLAQTPSIPKSGTEITKAIPPSPDAAALGKYGRTPVSYFTGVPDISIPLYTIKSGDLTLPVSLSYHSGGIKVEEQASSVGLGWVLNAGGSITRTVRGNADESTAGYLSPSDYVGNIYRALVSNQPSNLTPTQAGTMLNKIVDGTYDGEADIFSFNFGGYSGQFSFSHTSGIIVSPQQNITFNYPYTEGNAIVSFTATTPDGVIYSFGSAGGVDAVEFAQRNATQKTYNNSWLLKSIVSPSGSRIDFTYKAETYTQAQPGGIKYRLTAGTGTDGGGQQLETDNDNGSSTAMHTMKLTSITFENGSLQVYANLNRLDINPYNQAGGATMVDSIGIYSSGLSRLYKLYYTNKINTRLRLDSLVGQLEPVAGTPTYKKQKYSFSYNPDIGLSGTMFYNQDWWGYYNGTNQTTLVPSSPDPISSSTLPGANRKPDAGYMTAGMLTKIRYPTNGYTLFYFEPHQTPNYDFGADTYLPSPQMTAFSNDNQSIYYKYDERNGNATHLMHVYSTDNTVSLMVVHLTAYGLKLGNNPPPPQFDYVSANIYAKDANGNYTTNVYNITNTDTSISLPQGYYQIRLLDNKQQTDTTKANYIRYSIAVNWSNHLSPTGGHYLGHTASGLRIARIEDYDGISAKPYNVRSYKYNLNDTTSSGYLNYQPSYSYNLTVMTGTYQQQYSNTYFVRTAVSNYPMATQHGAVVGYYHVEEDYDKNGVKGKEDYYYSIDGAEGVNGSGFPFAPPGTREWHEGLLTSQVTSRYNGNGFYPVKKKINVYNTINSVAEYNSIKAGFNPFPAVYGSSTNYYGNGMLIQPYTTLSDYSYLSSDTTYVYDLNDPTKMVKTWSNYQMDPVTYQLTRLQSLTSKNELVTQTVTYPNSATATIKGVANLNGLHIYTYPVEEITNKSVNDGSANGSNPRTVKAVLNTYKSNKPYRDTVFEFRSVTPVTNFTNATGGSGRDSRYQPVVAFDKYDAVGNILQERKIGDALRSYIWAYKSSNPPYNNTYPIAEVLNADSASIAYTNFEDYSTNGLGNWVYASAGTTTDVTAPMGIGSYTVSSSNTLSKSGLASANSYVVSLWTKTGASITVTGGTVTPVATGAPKSGWTYREYSVTGTTTVTIGGTGQVDEVRLYPATAQMSTYTYVPLVGIASKCDVKNAITYFIYDNIGRLTQVLDQNSNIVKDYKYNYLSTDPLWIDVSPATLQCVKDPNNNNTGEQQKLQIDNNPSSDTYQKTRWLSMGIVTSSCPVPPPPTTLYVTMTLASSYTSGSDTFNTYRFDVFSDAAATTSYNVLSNLAVNYDITITTRTNGSVTGTQICHSGILIPAGYSTATADPIDVTACITCGGGGGGTQSAVQSGSQTDSTAGGATTNTGGGGGGTGTTCSSTVALKTGTGYTPKY